MIAPSDVDLHSDRARCSGCGRWSATVFMTVDHWDHVCARCLALRAPAATPWVSQPLVSIGREPRLWEDAVCCDCGGPPVSLVPSAACRTLLVCLACFADFNPIGAQLAITGGVS